MCSLKRSVRANHKYMARFKSFKADDLLMDLYWNKYMTKTSIVCVPMFKTGVLIKAISDWFVMGVIICKPWSFCIKSFESG